MKRNYVKPTIETVEMELLSIIASSGLNEGEWKTREWVKVKAMVTT